MPNTNDVWRKVKTRKIQMRNNKHVEYIEKKNIVYRQLQGLNNAGAYEAAALWELQFKGTPSIANINFY